MKRWPLFFIAAPAAVAVWSGWVGLGTLCGFGVIHPLPGIWDALRLNTAITLPVVTLGFGAGLAHLLRNDDAQSRPAGGEITHPDYAPAVRDLPGAPEVPADPVTLRAALNGHAAKAEKLFAAEVTAGRVPGIRRIMSGLSVGDAKARLVQEHLRSLTQ